jgi:hypothetical protein
MTVSSSQDNDTLTRLGPRYGLHCAFGRWGGAGGGLGRPRMPEQAWDKMDARCWLAHYKRDGTKRWYRMGELILNILHSFLGECRLVSRLHEDRKLQYQ